MQSRSSRFANNKHLRITFMTHLTVEFVEIQKLLDLITIKLLKRKLDYEFSGSVVHTTNGASCSNGGGGGGGGGGDDSRRYWEEKRLMFLLGSTSILFFVCITPQIVLSLMITDDNLKSYRFQVKSLI